uniref:Uncharacterized protein n=1 Tax=Aplanochytrium stocchinoi TaxID=215587 RepID=A0A7S3PR37_9STRA
MEFAVVANDCPRGALLGLLLARVCDEKYIKKVYLLLGERNFENIFQERWGISLYENGKLVNLPGNALKILPYGTTKTANLNLLRRCHTFIVCLQSRPNELQDVGAWITEHFKSQICVMCMDTGLDFRFKPLLSKLDINRREKFSLRGCVGFQACISLDSQAKEVRVSKSSHGSIILDRVSREKKSLETYCKIFELIHGVNVEYGSSKQANNWLYGDILWRSLRVYAEIRYGNDDSNQMSLYEQLESSQQYRLVCATILSECYSSLKWEDRSLLGHESSPFGINLYLSILLLRLPEMYFSPCLNLCLWFYTMGSAKSIQGNKFGESNIDECNNYLELIIQRASHHGIMLPMISHMHKLLKRIKQQPDESIHEKTERKDKDFLDSSMLQFEIVKPLSFSLVTFSLTTIPFVLYFLVSFIQHAHYILRYT